jgi:hypothetical protein
MNFNPDELASFLLVLMIVPVMVYRWVTVLWLTIKGHSTITTWFVLLSYPFISYLVYKIVV